MSTSTSTHRRLRCGGGVLRSLILLMIVFILGRQSAFRRPLMSSLSPMTSSASSVSTRLSTPPTVVSIPLVDPSFHPSEVEARSDGTLSGRIIGGNNNNNSMALNAIAEKLSNSLASIKAAMTTTNPHKKNDNTISTASKKVHVTNANDIHESYISCRMPHESQWLLRSETTSATPNQPAADNNNNSNNNMTMMIPRILHSPPCGLTR